MIGFVIAGTILFSNFEKMSTITNTILALFEFVRLSLLY